MILSIEKYIDENLQDLDGKVIIVTGATGVLAKYVVEGLVKKGATIVFCYRNFDSAVKRQQEILSKYKDASINLEYLDLSDFNCVKEFCERMKENYGEGIDALINLAGCFNIPQSVTSLGYDSLFQTNTIIPIYLSRKLFPLIEKKKGRIVNVSSLSYSFFRGYDEDGFEYKDANAIKKYAYSKRFLTLFGFNESMQLRKKESDVSIITCHPGVCATNIIHYKNGGFSKGLYNFANWFMKVVFPPPEKMALCILKAVCVPPPDYLCMISPSTGVYGYPKIKKVKLDSDEKEDMAFVINKAEQILTGLDK